MFSRIFPKSISTDLHNLRLRWLYALHFRNLSNCCKHKYDPDNFTNFLICNFWRVFVIWNYCAAQRCHRWACHVTKMKNSHAQWKGARVLASNVTRAMQHITKLNQRKNMQVRFYNNHSLETRAHGNKTPNMESCFPRYFSRFFFSVWEVEKETS